VADSLIRVMESQLGLGHIHSDLWSTTQRSLVLE